ncbi:MAG: diaminobutyrate--2-oxoglutarate transaminase [Azospirillaceae bacterium]
MGASDLDLFDRLESEVRSYSRDFPTVFRTASGSRMTDEAGRSYLDFFAGAGTLNYGHNPAELKHALIDYLVGDGITHGLDLATSAKRRLIERFQAAILAPRGLSYKMQFPGPTGANAVEAALKLARKATGRSGIVAFTNGFHGVTQGAVAVTGNAKYRRFPGHQRGDVAFLPYDGWLGETVDTVEVAARYLDDPASGIDAPAAFLVETVQGEGGVNVASADWLRRLADLARRHGSLIIVDDIQVGCGRTGAFFSFERAGVEPDIVTLSKSLSGFGLPLAMVLMRPDLDVWRPGEHNGTFRGNNLAFVTAAEAIDRFWSDGTFADTVASRGATMRQRLEAMAARANTRLSDGPAVSVRGLGMIQGLDLGDGERASAVCRAAFERGLIIETSGARGQVVKCLPPLTTEAADLAAGLDVLEAALDAVLGEAAAADSPARAEPVA